MGDIIDFLEILKEKEIQDEVQDEYEREALRAQLRWVLQRLHEKNAENPDPILEIEQPDGWLRRTWRRLTLRHQDDDT